MQWTTEQFQIINNFRDKNILVSAAAGSGKTTVLVERIIKIIIEDRVNIDRLLIVTFTRAAAAEMRIKIQEAIEERLEEGNEDNNYLIEQLNLLYKAKISTIHSFCKDLIRSNFHLLDLDPAFSMVEEGEKNLLISEAINDVLEDAYQDPEIPFKYIVEAFSGNRDDRKIEKIILDLYYFSISQPYPFIWLGEMSKLYDIKDGELNNHIWLHTIADKIRLELEGNRELLLNAADISELPTGPTEYLTNLDDELQIVESLISGLNKGFHVFLDRIGGVSFGRLKSIRGKRKEEVDSSLQDEVKKLRKEVKDSITNLQKKYSTADLDRYEEQIKKLQPMISYLIQLVKSFSLRFEKLKKEKNLMDFNDLEHYAIKILENEGVRVFLQNKFRYIFVDEYQDSNMVQETIINQVSRGNNLFLVGDVKQSIYRFRLAEPSLFIKKYNDFEKFEVDKELRKDSVRIDLSKNFRSRGEILKGINYLFERLMSSELGEIEYDSSARLYKGLDFEKIAGPELELNIIEKKTDGLDINQEIEDMGQAEVEAHLITDKIEKLIGQKYYNARKARYQEITYRDIVILMRSPGTRAETYQEVFTGAGIPLFVDDDSGFFDTLEIKIFLNLLRLIDNRRQDIPLLSVLKSPIVNLTADHLADIRVNKPEGSFYDAVLSYLDDDNLNTGIRCKLLDFMNKLKTWIEEERYLGIDKFIWKLLQESGFYSYAGAMPGGRQRQANLRILVDRAKQFAGNSEQSLFNYIRYIERLEEQQDNETGTARLINENEDVVRLMSIHKSKGLEFPVVIVAELGKRFNTNDLKGSLLLHRELGLGPKFVDPENRIYNYSLPQLAIKERKRRENLSEELRILYVALTRAIDRLILFGTASNLEKRSKKWLRG
ncbi:MAG: helicase-exonuclease AddAB subunit AddA, partial [Halanaerobiales bacterium]